MGKTLHVTFDGKVLRPEETVGLKPNVSYIVTVEEEELRGGQDLWSILKGLTGKVEGPQDWSKEHDHYLYGSPKRE